MVMAVHRGRSRSRARGARNELGDRRAGQQHEKPDADQLEPVAQASCLRQQPEHHETQPEIVRLGERVQSRQRIGKAKQADGAGEKEERAGRDGDDRHDVEREAHPPSVDSGASRPQARRFLS